MKSSATRNQCDKNHKKTHLFSIKILLVLYSQFKTPWSTPLIVGTESCPWRAWFISFILHELSSKEAGPFFKYQIINLQLKLEWICSENFLKITFSLLNFKQLFNYFKMISFPTENFLIKDIEIVSKLFL